MSNTDHNPSKVLDLNALDAVIKEMTDAPLEFLRHTPDWEGDKTYSIRNSNEPVDWVTMMDDTQYYPTALKINDAAGIVVLRNAASTLIAHARKMQRYREIIDLMVADFGRLADVYGDGSEAHDTYIAIRAALDE